MDAADRDARRRVHGLRKRIGGRGGPEPRRLLRRGGVSINDFIDRAGATTQDADRSRAYVVGPDGLARPLGRLSSRGLRDGDTVVVPTDLKKLPPLPLWASVTQILSNMAIGLAAIRTL